MAQLALVRYIELFDYTLYKNQIYVCFKNTLDHYNYIVHDIVKLIKLKDCIILIRKSSEI